MDRQESIGAPRRLRALAVQTTPTCSAEVTVLRMILTALDEETTGDSPQVVLVQGVDSNSPGGHQAAEAFAGLRSVSVHPLEVGRLGRGAESGRAQAAKVLDVARLWTEFRRLGPHLDEFRPDLVYSAQQRWDQRLACRLADRMRIPRVVHLHYTVGPWLGADAVRALATADAVIAVSEFLRADAAGAGVPARRVHTLLNPAPLPPSGRRSRACRPSRFRRELGIPEQATVVGMVGRLSPSKGQVSLLHAMLPLLSADASVHLVLAGQEYPAGNGMTRELGRLAADADVSRQVHLVGHRTDVPAVLEALDVFAHPSRSEPCAMSILEAMAYGLPVVAWREGGTVELVSHMETGILVQAMDIPGLTLAIQTLVRDAALRARMGDSAQKRAGQSFRTVDTARRFSDLLSLAALGEAYAGQGAL